MSQRIKNFNKMNYDEQYLTENSCDCIVCLIFQAKKRVIEIKSF